jgi:hypothetical protein
MFRENMGILGLEQAGFLSDRIFSAIDLDNDKKVSNITTFPISSFLGKF